MARPTGAFIDTKALLHNLNQVKIKAPHSQIIAMVKANGYGCGIEPITLALQGLVSGFGVACTEEAHAIRKLGIQDPCVLFQGVFSPDEIESALTQNFQLVLHQTHQLRWLLEKPLSKPIKIWVKVNTGMNRLGFLPNQVEEIVRTLMNCPWVSHPIGLITHLACADEPNHPKNREQCQIFQKLKFKSEPLIYSICNSAGIITMPEEHADVVRPGIMLYGVSPLPNKTGQELGLRPVMRFTSAISAINECQANSSIGYGAVWKTTKPSRIGIVAAGYGDGYPRHVRENTKVWVNGFFAPIVGRVSMDMMAVDLTDYPQVKVGDPVELWGKYIPVESVAHSAGTIPYELLCQFSPRGLT